MMAIQLDTLKIVEQLEKAGYSTQQAKAQTAILASAISDEAAWAEDKFAAKSTFTQELSGVKSEIGLLRQELKSEVGSLRQELKSEIGSLRQELKSEIGSLRQELKSEIGLLRQETKALNSDTKAELIRWVVGVGMLQMGLIAGLLLKLTH
jgi:HAMP domain-containing protein